MSDFLLSNVHSGRAYVKTSMKLFEQLSRRISFTQNHSKKHLKTMDYRNISTVFAVFFAVFLSALVIKCGVFKKSPPPEFYFAKDIIYHPDSTIIVQAANEQAKKVEPLILKIDNSFFPEAAAAVQKENDFFWYIQLNKLTLHDTLRNDGEHKICFGFKQSKMSQISEIFFDSSAPQFYGGIDSKYPGEKRIFGYTFDNNQSKNQNITVELGFGFQEKGQTISPPLKKYISESGRILYQFEYRFQNIPRASQENQQSFFLLKVTDATRNEFRKEFDYKNVIANRAQKFGSNDTVRQIIEKEKASGLKQIADSTALTNTQEIDSEALIFLQVQEKTSKYVIFSWNRLPDSLQTGQEEYVIMRKNQAFASTFNTSYTDYAVTQNSSYQYQVLARALDNKNYPSNIVSLSIPTALINIDCSELVKESNMYNEARIASISGKLTSWIKRHPRKLEGLAPNLMLSKKDDFTSKAKFYFNDQLYELLLLYKEKNSDFTFFLTNLENNEAVMLNYLGFSEKTNYLKIGEVYRDDSGRIVEFTSKSYQPTEDATSVHYCRILLWWENR